MGITTSGFQNGAIWAGDKGDKADPPFIKATSEPFVAVLADEYLYMKTFWRKAARDDAVRRLEDLETEETVLGSGADKIHLPSIKELRLCWKHNLLEIYHGPSNRSFKIRSDKDPIHEWVFFALWARLAPDVDSTVGRGSRRQALAHPLGWLAVVLTYLALWMIFPEVTERILNDLNIGVTGAAAIASVIVLGLIGWTIYRWQNPHSAEVITIPGREG
jgi:hypothetical protein